MKPHTHSIIHIRSTLMLLVTALISVSLTGCFDSTTEEAPPSVIEPEKPKPTTGHDTLSVPVDKSGDVSVLDNDSASGGGSLSIGSFDATTTQLGTVVNNGDGTLRYTPPAAYEGEDTFTYTAKSSNGTTALGTVTVTVSAAVIPNGQAFYADNCAICHSYGADDTTIAFNASNLSLSTSRITKNLTAYGGDFKLMGAFYDIPQNNVDELKAYLTYGTAN